MTLIAAADPIRHPAFGKRDFESDLQQEGFQMTTHDMQLQYVPASEFLTDAKIAVLGFKLVKDDPRHQHHDMRERARAKARRCGTAAVDAVPEIEVRHV